jgi:hypothetical protein
MKPILLSTKEIEKGSYIISIDYYDNDDLVVAVLDFETRETLGFIDIVDEIDLGFDINLN